MKNKGNEIIFKGISGSPGKFFNKEIICINDVNCLKEDLELYVELSNKKLKEESIQRVIDFTKYKIGYPEMVKVFTIWANREKSAKLAEREKMRGVHL